MNLFLLLKQNSVREQRHLSQTIAYLEDSAKEDSENQLKEFHKELQKNQKHLQQEEKEETSTSELVLQVFQGAEIHSNER